MSLTMGGPFFTKNKHLCHSSDIKLILLTNLTFTIFLNHYLHFRYLNHFIRFVLRKDFPSLLNRPLCLRRPQTQKKLFRIFRASFSYREQ